MTAAKMTVSPAQHVQYVNALYCTLMHIFSLHAVFHNRLIASVV